MISAITPVMNTNTYSVQQNHKYNNQQQNFGAMRTQFKNLSISRKADEISEAFVCHFEDVAKKIGVDTEKLSKKGYSLIVNGADYGKNYDEVLAVALVDKNGKIIQNACYPGDGSEKASAETFLDNIKRLKLLA